MPTPPLMCSTGYRDTDAGQGALQEDAAFAAGLS